jgi:hypothetical protein
MLNLKKAVSVKYLLQMWYQIKFVLEIIPLTTDLYRFA